MAFAVLAFLLVCSTMAAEEMSSGTHSCGQGDDCSVKRMVGGFARESMLLQNAHAKLKTGGSLALSDLPVFCLGIPSTDPFEVLSSKTCCRSSEAYSSRDEVCQDGGSTSNDIPYWELSSCDAERGGYVCCSNGVGQKVWEACPATPAPTPAPTTPPTSGALPVFCLGIPSTDPFEVLSSKTCCRSSEAYSSRDEVCQDGGSTSNDIPYWELSSCDAERGGYVCCSGGAGQKVWEACPATPPTSGTGSCGACLAAFDEANGCQALLNSDFGVLDHFVACENCMDAVLPHCFPHMANGTCSSCVEAFAAAGGCEVMRAAIAAPEQSLEFSAQIEQLIPPGCFPCGEDAGRFCSEQQEPPEFDAQDCDKCIEAFAEAGVCELLRTSPQANVSESLPGTVAEQCQHMGAVCGQRVMSHCLATPAENCTTAREGDSCFMHVRWAMQVGIAAHPEWYEGLTLKSTFEDFQRHLYFGSHHSCPLPCPAMTSCHTAVPGEECHDHVTWAKDFGINLIPEWYPAMLTNNSSVEDFQDWLHHIHHGDCPMPCA